MNTLTQTKEGAAAARPEPALLPPVDVIEDATGITLYADLPGVSRDKLGLRVDG
ncbi:MAG: Hsp20/alpha crystallin family protein, partial [Rubrivivax sp.]|nr:Hsp20/alpha crystallin family protein [Rubrivivax sp.]